MSDAKTFIEAFLSYLGQDNFYQGQSLLEYLEQPEELRGNDEADVVDDKITRRLLEALGYRDSEITYNRNGAGGRADFIVQIANYPRPTLVVEDKNTVTTNLADNLPQLERYLRATSAARGLLCDGKRLIAYELSDPSPVVLFDLSLQTLVEYWRGESLFAAGKIGYETLSDKDITALTAFYGRFNREAFAGLERLINDLTLDKSGKPHTRDGSSWTPAQAKISIQPADTPEAMEQLIKDVRVLIREVEYDVEAQLAQRLGEYAKYQEALEQLLQNGPLQRPFPVRLGQFFQALRSQRLEESHIQALENRLKSQLEHHTERDLHNTFGKEILEAINNLPDVEVKEAQVSGEQAGLDNQVKQGKKAKKILSKKLSQLPRDLDEHLSAFNRFFHYYHEQREKLSLQYQAALEVAQSFQTWRDRVATLLLPGASPERLQHEFAAQTAYILLVRMLLVRILEDKGLIDRMFTNGGLALWFHEVEPRYLKFAQGRSSEFLLDMAYANAQHVYAHFYSGILLFDWYVPDRNRVVRILYRLAGYNLSTINHDIMGHLYSRYVEDEHKHESGMYYTPPEVVEYILDRLRFSGESILEQKRLLDPACGSGTFLVSAARRVVQAYKDFYKNAIPPKEVQGIVNAFKDSIYGLDLNPFACYLAETNLLIQVLDLLKIAYDGGEDVHIDRFHIYNTDTLRYSQRAREVLVGGGSLAFSAEGLPTEEQIKAKRGEFERGFDFVVANPPYVRADEGAVGLLEYRKDLKENHPVESVKEVLERKWDLFVPFVALGKHLLTEGGRMGMITSNAIEMVPYAEAVRQQLVKETRVDEVTFFSGVNLFADAAVANTIFFATSIAPMPEHETLRRWFDGQPTEEHMNKEEKAQQSVLGEKVFRQQLVQLDTANLVPLEDICYISVGMVLNADEKRAKGAFTKDDLLSEVKNKSHPLAYIEGKDIDPFQLHFLRYLEYGPGLRAPELIRRPTFPELYNRPKIIRGRTSYAILDNKLYDDWLYTNHSGIVIIRWDSLKDVDNRSLAAYLDREILEEQSSLFEMEYLLGIINSDFGLRLLKSEGTSSRQTEIEPEALKALQIPVASPDQQQPIVKRVNRLQELGLEFFRLRRDGWRLGRDVRASAHIPSGVNKAALSSAKILWKLRPLEVDAKLNGVWAGENGLYRGGGHNTRHVIESDAPVEALEWLVRQFALLDEETTWQMAEAKSLEIPSRPVEAIKALEILRGLEAEVKEKMEEFARVRKEVDDLVAALYKTK